MCVIYLLDRSHCWKDRPTTGSRAGLVALFFRLSSFPRSAAPSNHSQPSPIQLQRRYITTPNWVDGWVDFFVVCCYYYYPSLRHGARIFFGDTVRRAWWAIGKSGRPTTTTHTTRCSFSAQCSFRVGSCGSVVRLHILPLQRWWIIIRTWRNDDDVWCVLWRTGIRAKHACGYTGRDRPYRICAGF